MTKTEKARIVAWRLNIPQHAAGEPSAVLGDLLAAALSQRRVEPPLKPSLPVPDGFTMPQEVDFNL